MSALQNRISKHAKIVSRFKTLSNDPKEQIEPLIHFIFRLCMIKNYTAAEEILSLLTESESFSAFTKLSTVWILRSEIAEEQGDLPKAVRLLQQSRKYQAQVHDCVHPVLSSTEYILYSICRHQATLCHSLNVPLQTVPSST